MENASFALKEYKFDNVSLEFGEKISDELNVSFEPVGVYLNKDRQFNLYLKLSISCKSETEQKPFLTIVSMSSYKFKNVEKIEEIPDYFYPNCAAIIFPYIRAYISIITTQANQPGIILPTINLSAIGPDIKKNTSVV